MKHYDPEAEKLKHPNGRRWPLEVKREAIEAIDAGLFTTREIMEMYGVRAYETIANWRKHLSRASQNRRTFRESARRRIAHEVRSGLMSVERAMETYGILDRETIPRWIAQYEQDHDLELMAKERKREPEKDQKYTSAEDELAALRKELEHERLKNVALETLIEVAEEELNIEIRKKPGAKQSEECGDDTPK